MIRFFELYNVFFAALAVLAILLVVTIITMIYILNRLNQLQDKVNSLTDEKNILDVAPPTDGIPEGESTTDPMIADTTKSVNEVQNTNESLMANKDKVLKAIQEIKEVQEKDLPKVCQNLLAYFAEYTNEDYTKDLNSKSYYRYIDLRDQPDTRVVVIGDIHCDYNSLAAILLKLSVSDYDYFDKAIFVFLGDYLDRGTTLFEPLMLLKSLKEILGDRLIMLKGNHESIKYDNDKRKIISGVLPNQSSQCLNEYCGNDLDFLQQFARFYSKLPIYVYLKTNEKNILLTHASIPRDASQAHIRFDESSGEIIFDANVNVTNHLQMRNAIFRDMIWGDPKNCDRKMQVEGRFEFGRLQFDHFAERNHIDMLFRSHEESFSGYQSFFDDRVFTIFSTGGSENEQTGYPSVEPAFAIIQNERFVIENNYIYKLKKDGKQIVLNLFNKQQYTDIQKERLRVGEEFESSQEQCDDIRTVFKQMKASFCSEED